MYSRNSEFMMLLVEVPKLSADQDEDLELKDDTISSDKPKNKDPVSFLSSLA